MMNKMDIFPHEILEEIDEFIKTINIRNIL